MWLVCSVRRAYALNSFGPYNDVQRVPKYRITLSISKRPRHINDQYFKSYFFFQQENFNLMAHRFSHRQLSKILRLYNILIWREMIIIYTLGWYDTFEIYCTCIGQKIIRNSATYVVCSWIWNRIRLSGN